MVPKTLTGYNLIETVGILFPIINSPILWCHCNREANFPLINSPISNCHGKRETSFSTNNFSPHWFYLTIVIKNSLTA